MAGLQALLEKRLLCGGTGQFLSSLPGKAVPRGVLAGTAATPGHPAPVRASGTDAVDEDLDIRLPGISLGEGDAGTGSSPRPLSLQ